MARGSGDVNRKEMQARKLSRWSDKETDGYFIVLGKQRMGRGGNYEGNQVR